MMRELCEKYTENLLSLSFILCAVNGCLSSIFTTELSRWECKSNEWKSNMKPQLRKCNNWRKGNALFIFTTASLCILLVHSFFGANIRDVWVCVFAVLYRSLWLRCVCVSCLHFTCRLLNIPDCLHSQFGFPSHFHKFLHPFFWPSLLIWCIADIGHIPYKISIGVRTHLLYIVFCIVTSKCTHKLKTIE